MDAHGRLEAHGRSWALMDAHGRSLTFRIFGQVLFDSQRLEESKRGSYMQFFKY